MLLVLPATAFQLTPVRPMVSASRSLRHATPVAAQNPEAPVAAQNPETHAVLILLRHGKPTLPTPIPARLSFEREGHTPPPTARAHVLVIGHTGAHFHHMATLASHRPSGQSVWNEASLFTGWADVELTTLGKNEAAQGATALWKEGYKIDVAYTSLLKRAQQTLDIVLKITGQEDVTVHRNWRLNERMYGGLTGLVRSTRPSCYPSAPSHVPYKMGLTP